MTTEPRELFYSKVQISDTTTTTRDSDPNIQSR